MSKKYENSAEWIADALKLINYIAASSLYLKDNYLLEEELTHDHIKNRILGHWGTVPGLAVLYLTISQLIAKKAHKKHDSLLITGPGHGAPAILTGSWLDDSLSALYDGKYEPTTEGMAQLIHDFSWPGGFQSHVTPMIPGSIHEGGELGYSLGTAFGTIMDNPNLINYVIVGDGEAESGALAASWQSNKFINPKTDGAVLPILHVNGYKISGPTIYGSYSHKEFQDQFGGLGYDVIIIDQYESNDFIQDTIDAFDTAYDKISDIQANYKNGDVVKWPMIVFKHKKGWTGPEMNHDKKVEDNNLSHGIPFKKPKTDEYELQVVNDWLKSYDITSYFNDDGTLDQRLYEYMPEKSKRLSQSPYSNKKSVELDLPSLADFDVEGKGRGEDDGNVLISCSDILAEISKRNPHTFRVFSPDESESNRLESLLDVCPRNYQWPVREHDDYISTNGRMLEILSEQVLQCWYQAYTMTGRHGIFLSYEAFFDVIASMIDQYIKFRKSMGELDWRVDQKGMTYLATSTLWRQEHNGYTHQNPSLINSLLAKQTSRVNIYFPIGVNTLLSTIHHSYTDNAYINYITAGKTNFPQWLTLEEAELAVREGTRVLDWCSDEDPDVVFVTIGDYQHHETIAGIDFLKGMVPNLKTKVVNVQRMTPTGIPGLTTESEVTEKLTADKPVIVNFHGYPEAIKQLFFGSDVSTRMTILGYLEKGGTTTPFNMQVLNKASRYHVALFAAQKLLGQGRISSEKAVEIETAISDILEKHDRYIRETGDDLPEVLNWKPTK